jgi:hypothetical protein
MLGAVIGCFLSIPAMSRLGRRGAALYPMSLAYLLGYILIGTATNVQMIIAGERYGVRLSWVSVPIVYRALGCCDVYRSQTSTIF